MSLGSTVSESSSRTSVDSADSGSQDEASLFWTSISFELSAPTVASRTNQTPRTIHLVMRPVSLPAM